MRATTTATTWTCDACPREVVLTDGNQQTPPEGWRLLKLLPRNVNMALEAGHPSEIKTRVLCAQCFTAPVIMSDVFSSDG